MQRISLGLALKTIRMSFSLSQQELAKTLGTKHSNISAWEKNKHRPTLKTVERYSEIFGLSVAEIFLIAEGKYEADNKERLRVLIKNRKYVANARVRKRD